MNLSLKKSSLNLFLTTAAIDKFSFITIITVNYVQWWRSFRKKSQIFFSNQVKKMKCSGATGLDISSFPEIKVGREKKINDVIKKKRSAGRKCFISIPFLDRILNCQFGTSCFFLCFCKGWSGPRAGWIWESKFGSTIWGDLVQWTYKRTEREQASVSIVICSNARWTMKETFDLMDWRWF